MHCPNINSPEWKSLVNKIGDTNAWREFFKYGDIPSADNYEVINDNNVLYQNQTTSNEGQIVSEKTIRDLAARMSDRIGMPFKIESDRTKEYKGKIEYNTAYINLAYATLDTPIHEILGHPIIRAIKGQTKTPYFKYDIKNLSDDKNAPGKYQIQYSENMENFDVDFFDTKEELNKFIESKTKSYNTREGKQLYQNLLKELETGKGKEVLDRIKRDYDLKENTKDRFDIINNNIEKFKNPNSVKGTFGHNNIRYYVENGKIKNLSNGEELTDSKIENIINELKKEQKGLKYTLEEQQEEAIVELLGLMTAEKLDNVKDGKLISLLKRLLKEIKAFMKQLLNQREVNIDKLPDNMTLNDLSDLLAYSNSKLILPGNEVIYTTPDNQQFKTYQEASNHISKLTKSVQDVDLNNININNNNKKYAVYKWNFGKQDLVYDNLTREEALIKQKEDSDYVIDFNEDARLVDIENFISKNKEYEQSKEIIEEWKKVNNIQYNPEEIYSRGQGFYSAFAAYSDLDLDTLMANILHHIEDNEKAGGKFALSAFTKPVDKTIRHIEKSGLNFVIFPQPQHIMWAANTDVYSGSVWDAAEKVNKDKKSELLGVSYTKYPALSNINSIQPNLASVVDNLAHHHNELGIQITGNNFRLEINKEVLNETDGQEYYKVNAWVNKINKILDQKYGKVIKPEIGNKYKLNKEKAENLRNRIETLNIDLAFENNKEKELERKNLEQEYEKIVKPIIGIQPIQTNETLKESIDTVKNKVVAIISETNINNGELFQYDGWEYLYENNADNEEGEYQERFGKRKIGEKTGLQSITKLEFEETKDEFIKSKPNKKYTSQALINTKIAALKEVAKKYPRSLIRSEVKRINTSSSQELYNQFELDDELPFQKIPTTAKKEILYSIKTKSVEEIAKGLNPELVRSEQQIKYTSFIKSLVLNKLGDIGPGKKLKMSPDEAFASAKFNFETAYKNIGDFINIIKNENTFNTLKTKDENRLNKLLGQFYLTNISSFNEAVSAANNYKNIIDNFEKYVDFVKIDLAHNGIRIVKNKIKNVDPEDVAVKNEDADNNSAEISQNEMGERYGKDNFETNPRDTATIRVKSLIQTIATGEYEFGVPIYANPNDVFADILEIGASIDLSKFNSSKTKLTEFKKQLADRAQSRTYLSNLLNKIESFEKNNEWERINDILKVASKAYATEILLLFKLRKNGSEVTGIYDTKVISTNRDSIDLQISKEWLFNHLQSDFYTKNSQNDLFPKQSKIDLLNKIIDEGANKEINIQIKKFQEFFNVLGIDFTEDEVTTISKKLHKALKYGTFNAFFQKDRLLKNITNSFQENIEQPFQGQYGFQNESTSMKEIAKIYYELNPNKYKITSTKTADNKSKYAYILPSYLEQIKREWNNGNTSSVTNGVLAKPNSKDQESFWNRVVRDQAKFKLDYFNGIREQKTGEKGDVRKSLTRKAQIISMYLLHQQNLNVGNYVAFTLSDKPTTMETVMTKEFFVNTEISPVGLDVDYEIIDSKINYTDELKKKVYNSFVEPEISRILASIKNTETINVENYEIASKLFYLLPNLNRNSNLSDFRNDLYSGSFTIEELSSKYSELVGEAVLNEIQTDVELEIERLTSLGIIVNKNNAYTFPFFINGYNQTDYVNAFRKTKATGKNIARLMVMDMKLNYLNSQIKTVQFLKLDPALAFKTSIDVKDKTISDISDEDKINIANTTWDEFSKRAALLVAPGEQGSWSWSDYEDASKDYITVTAKDVKVEVKDTDGTLLNKSEITDAEEFVTMQEHIDYLMHLGNIPYSTWLSIHNKIKKAGPGGYYELTSEELGLTISPTKPVYVNYTKIGDEELGLNRIDYVKSSRYPLIPQHEAGSERDKLRIWMEKNNVRSVNFASGKKLGRPSKSLELFDKDNNFVEPSNEDFESSMQLLSRDGIRNQQEIPEQKTEIATVSQMNRTIFDGLLDVKTFNFGNMKNVSGAVGKELKEAVRAKLFDIESKKLEEKLGNLNVSHEKLYELLKDIIVNDTTGSYTQNDLLALEIDPKTKKFKIPLEAQYKLKKFQSLINSLIDKNVMLKVDGTSFVQVSGVGSKFTFSKVSKGIKSDIIWIDKYADNFAKDGATLKYIRQEGKKVKVAQVIVSQYLRDDEGNLIDLNNYIKEDKLGRKILDTSKMNEKMFQLVGTRIPNQSHPSTLPIEVVGFLPSYMENSIVVPDGITGQMGSDFDVDKLYAYFSKFKYNKETTKERLGADEEEFKELVKAGKKLAEVAKEKKDISGRYYNFNTYLTQAIKEKYGDKKPPTFKEKIPASIEQITYDLNSLEDINKLNKDQLNQLYRDIHWEVLTNSATFNGITKAVDMPEVKEKVKLRNEELKKYNLVDDVKVNLPLDYMTSINRYVDNRDGKTGVSIFATLISAQADFQDKIIQLKTDEETNKSNPIQIKLSKDSEIINLEFIGNLGKSTSFLNEERSISENLNMMFSESVDNAKNQFLREFNWTQKAMSPVGLLAMLTDSKGNAVPIDFMMDLTSQSSIINLFEMIEQKQDSFGQYDSNAFDNSAIELQDEIIKKINEEGYLPENIKADYYFNENKKRTKILDVETLSESWLIGKAIDQKANDETLEKIADDLNYKSVNEMMLNYYNVQFNTLELFSRLEITGRELMTILGAIYPYTKGIGANVFSTKQKLNQLNKLSNSSVFEGLDKIAGPIVKLDNGDMQIKPVGEIGSAINNSLIFAQDKMYKSLFPISSGSELESTVDKILDFMGLDKLNLSKDKYESFYDTTFRSIISYIYTDPSFELFEDVVEERNRLINGPTSIGYRINELKKDPEFAKNGFLKNIEIVKEYKTDTYTISFKDPFGTESDDKEVTSGFYNLALNEKNEIKQLAKDLALYPFATGDAGNLGRFIPVGYLNSDADFNKAMGNFENSFVNHLIKTGSQDILIDQIVQNNPEMFSKSFSFTSNIEPGKIYYSAFKTVLKKITNADRLKKVNKFTIKIGDFPTTEKYEGIIKSFKIPLSDTDVSIKNMITTIPKGIDFKYPQYLLIKDEISSDIDSIYNEKVSYLYKRTSPFITENGDATYERIEILGHKNISEFDFNNPNLVSVIEMNNVSRDEIIEENKQDILNQPPSVSTPTTKTAGEPKGEKIKDGIYVNQEGLTKEEQLELFEYLKPILEKQAVRSNVGTNAPKMAGLELNWDYVRNRPTQTRVDVKGALRPNNTYGWFEKSANGLPLEKMSARFKELMSKAVGIDVSDYDGSIVNIYNDKSFISNHPDIDESKTAENYPVVVANIGGTGSIVVGTNTDNEKRSLKPGAGYLFGFQGKNRTIMHSTYPTATKGFLPAITTEIDGETYPAGSYRISITMRRVMPLEEGMPIEPAIIKSATSAQEGTSNPTDYTNHSGGAYGGDTFWDIIGREFGVTKHMHYKDAGNANLSQTLKNKGVKATVLTKEQMDIARTEVEKLLGKKYPDTLEGNLQVRNYYQVANADAVFAIAEISPTTKPMVMGGTDTAVQLGIKMNKPVYVFDLDTNKWYTQDLDFLANGFDSTKHNFDYNGWLEINTPTLTKNFAGVGSRDLQSYNVKNKKTGAWEPRKQYKGIEIEEIAKQAIRDVYEKTFKSTQPSINVNEETLLNQIGDTIVQTSKLKYKTVNLNGVIEDITKTEKGYDVTLRFKSYNGSKTEKVIIENGNVIKTVYKNPLKIGEFIESKKSSYNFEFSKQTTQPSTSVKEGVEISSNAIGLAVQEEEIEDVFVEEPEVKITTVEYGGKTYIIEGTQEENNLKAFFQAKGEKGKAVSDVNLLNKVMVAHTANLYPERVITLLNIKNQPKYLINLENKVISLQESSYGKLIEAPNVIQKVMSLFSNPSQIEKPVVKKEVKKEVKPNVITEEVKYIPNYIEVNGKKLEIFKWNKKIKIPITLTKDQEKAVRMMVNHFEKTPNIPFILKGKAGTGKTTVIRVINEYFKNKSSVIITPTHKAGKNASTVTYGNTQSRYRTFASAYYGKKQPDQDILIFDEVSMLNDTDLIKLQKGISSYQMAIFMGDERQLPPIKYGKLSPFFYDDNIENIYELTEVMRFDEQGSIFKIANEFADNLKKYNVIKQYPEKLISEKDAVYAVDSSKRLIDAYIHFYNLESKDPSKVRLIAYGNKTAELYNNEIRNIIFKGNAQTNVVNNNDLLIGNLGWSTKNVLASPMVNSSEYKVVEEPVTVNRKYGDYNFKGQSVTFIETVSGDFEVAERTITVINPEDSENKDLYNYIASTIINFKNTGKQYESDYNIILDAIEKSGIYSLTTMYAKPVKMNAKKEVVSVELYTLEQMLEIIKKENPTLSNAKLLNMIDNDIINQYYKIEPTVSFGYAITTHKSQGSTYKHVLVDEVNMSFNDALRKTYDQNNEFYAYEANQMRYVGFSRPTTTLVVYTNKPIGDDLIYDEIGTTGLSNNPMDFISMFMKQSAISSQNEIIAEMFGKNKTANSILNTLYKNTSPFYKEILNLVSKTGGVGNLKILVDENMTNPGAYDAYNEVITINPKLAFESDPGNASALFDVLIHELLHHVTAKIVNADKSKLSLEQRKWVVALENLFKYTQDKMLNDPRHKDKLSKAIDEVNKEDGFLSVKDKSLYYGLTNINDFISMLMSDKNFRNFMNNVSYTGEKTIFDRFIDIFVSIIKSLGIIVKDDSVLKEGLQNIIGIVESRNIEDSDSSTIDLKSIRTQTFLDGIVESEFDKIIKYLDIKTKCK